MRVVKSLGAKGAALAEYVVLMGIVGGLAIFAIMNLGADVREVYGEMDSTVATEIQEASGLPVGSGGGGNVPPGTVNVSVNRTIQLFCTTNWEGTFSDILYDGPAPPGTFDRLWHDGAASWTVQVVSGNMDALSYYIFDGKYFAWDDPDGEPTGYEVEYFLYAASEENQGWFDPGSPWIMDCDAPPPPFQIRAMGYHQDGSTAEVLVLFVPTAY